MQKISLFFIFSFCIFSLQCPQALAEKQTNMTLKTAFEKAVTHNPALKSLQENISMASGELRQTRFLPNPNIKIEIEKIGGSGMNSGTGSLESSVAIGQEIITAGKTSKKIKAAKISKQLAVSEFELQKLHLKMAVTEKYLTIFSFEDLIKIEAEYLKLSKENAEAVAKKVAAGEVPMMDSTRANVELANAKIEHKKLTRQLETTYIELAAQWGETDADFGIAPLKTQQALITKSKLSDLEEELKFHPELKIADKQLKMAHSVKAIAKANSIANFEFEAGVKKSRADGEHFYFAGISMPLQLFNRNQGNIDKASAQIKKTENDYDQALLLLKTRLIKLEQQLASITEENENAITVLIPGANQAYAQMQRAYDEGERQLFELFDARRVLLEAKKVSVQLESEKLKVIAEICLLTNKEDLLFQIINQTAQEGNND